jgi:PleD family two-component response regulator
MIVDDIPLNIHVLAQCLSDRYEIRAANSGKRCLELLAAKSSDVDLVLLDVIMPEMDGYEVLRQLKCNKDIANIPVIYVTDKHDETDEEKGFALGAVDYITKPIRSAIVQARVATHITLKRQRDSLVQMASRDQLSGLYNRHYLFEAAEQAVAAACRHGRAISVLMCDIDKFKDINDQYGHGVGDRVI